jgi:transposase-like protein
VSEKATRRRFTAKYKLRILEAVEACTESGDIGSLLRREGLYTSHLTHWREPHGTPLGDEVRDGSSSEAVTTVFNVAFAAPRSMLDTAA